MAPTPPEDAPQTARSSSPRTERNDARRRIVRITQATAAAAALTTGAVAVLAATTQGHAASAVTGVSDPSTIASDSTTTNENSLGTLVPAPSAPTPTDQPPVASSGAS